MVEISVTNALPAAGFEFDAGSVMSGLIPMQLYTLGPGGKQLRGEVFVISDSVRHGVNQAAEYSFRARGTLALWS